MSVLAAAAERRIILFVFLSIRRRMPRMRKYSFSRVGRSAGTLCVLRCMRRRNVNLAEVAQPIFLHVYEFLIEFLFNDLHAVSRDGAQFSFSLSRDLDLYFNETHYFEFGIVA